MESKSKVRPIKGYEDTYTISLSGEVKNIKTGKVLSQKEIGTGYICVQLYKKGRKQTKLVHRLLLEAFKERPPGKNYSNHIDGNKKNNSLDNLEWVTFRENIIHYWESASSDSHPNPRRPILARHTITEMVLFFPSISDAGRVGFDVKRIINCCRGRAKTHKAYRWCYVDKQDINYVLEGSRLLNCVA